MYRKNAVQQVRDGFYALAVGSLTSALALLPNSVELLTERGVLHICSGDPAAAVSSSVQIAFACKENPCSASSPLWRLNNVSCLWISSGGSVMLVFLGA